MLVIGLLACSSSNNSTSTPTNNQPAPPSNESTTENKEEEAKGITFPEDGKQLRIVIPLSPGGGFDTQVRMLAPIWEKHLNGKIIVENKPGGTYNIGVNDVWRSEPDGYTVGVFPGTIANQVVTDVPYDLNAFEWIGQFADSTFVFAVSKQSGFTSMEDIIHAEQKPVVGAAGLTAVAGVANIVAADVFGFEQDIINHEGSTEAILAGIRGDADIVYQSYESLRQHFESGDLIPIFVGSRERMPELPDVPSITEFSGEATEGLISLGTLPRILAATPNTPEEIVSILRETFKAAVEDPEFVEQMQNNKSPAKYASGEEISELVKSVLEQFELYKDTILSYQ